MKKSILITTVVLIILIIDQWSKIWIKTNMYLYESFPIFGLDWAYINFIENKGMAFGISFGGDIGKAFLSLFRVAAVGLLIYFLTKIDEKKVNKLMLVSFALVLAGAIGNIIDSLFYGIIFTESTMTQLAEIFPEKGYTSFLHGKVVDMFYFPMIDTTWPSWIPIIGGGELKFFQPVFNVADSAISVGIFLLLLFNSAFFKDPERFLIDKNKVPEQVEEGIQ